ncbi:hypothetical protein CHS0354_031401 [Potamilus streckersoni]|uniref:Transmembrane protein 11 n=1 Tax=Potamilus streckersoni TaxID=2493646 RepID=A0AAE0VX86_9BIVA|nr:hypothetical protein CHS0354_031401 [Potamilus streckersoni]
MAVSSARLAGTAPECVIIREIYENGDAQEEFEQELERALEARAKIIVIEPMKLGNEIARWIAVGNFLHKACCLSGCGVFLTELIFPEKMLIKLPLGMLSIMCAAVYGISWQNDPCCKYQVEGNVQRLKEVLPVYKLSSCTPVILVRKDDTRRKFLQNFIAGAVGLLGLWKLYKYNY